MSAVEATGSRQSTLLCDFVETFVKARPYVGARKHALNYAAK